MERKRMVEWWIGTVGVAALYVGTARLGFLLAIPPGNVTVLWPPSGIALAAALVFGRRAGLGIWVGSLLVNVWFFFQKGTMPSLAIATAASIALGSTAQAFLGAGLIRRLLGSPEPPTRPEDTVKFMGIEAAACLVGAAVGVTSLCLGGFVPWGNYGATWGTWWLGDFVGTVVFGPLLLVLNQRVRRRLAHGVLAFPLISSIAGLSLLAFFIIWNFEQQAIRSRFERDTVGIVASLQRQLHSSIHDLEAIAAFYAASSEVTRDEFRAFARPLLTYNPSLQAVSWNPFVPASERPAYEQAAQEGGLPAFRFTEKTGEGRLIAAGDRLEYVPVYYIEPQKENEPALGFDLASEPTRRKALERMRTAGRPAATAPIQLVQERGNQKGVIIFWPIARHADPAVPGSEMRLAGCASGVFRIGDLLNRAMSSLETRGIDVYLLDEDMPVDGQLMHAHPERTDSSAPTVRFTLSQLRRGFHQATPLELAGRTWTVLCRPSAAYLQTNRTWQPWGILVIGTLITGFLVVYLKQRHHIEEGLRQAQDVLERRVQERTVEISAANEALASARDQLETRVRERTAELSIANERLRAEVIQRQQAQETLAKQNDELTRRNDIMLTREERVLELKQEINALLKELGRPEQYHV